MESDIKLLIEANRKERSPELILDRMDLSSIPNEVFRLEHLTTLSLRGNSLTNLPSAISALKNLRTLRLDDNELTRLPVAISELTELKGLSLEGNQFTDIPSELLQLRNLEYLGIGLVNLSAVPPGLPEMLNLRRLRLSSDWRSGPLSVDVQPLTKMRFLKDLGLSGIGLKSLPDGFSEFTDLEFLSLRDNQLTTVPDWISRFTSLDLLDLANNNLTVFPPAILNLLNLRTLHLGDNKITKLPDAISNLQNLENLTLYRNEIKNLPESFSELRNLRYLNCWNCLFESFPAALYRMPNLEYLSFRNNSTTVSSRSENNITELSRDILNLTKLTTLELYDNAIKSPPPEIVNRGIDAVRQYFKDLEVGEDHLFEAKLLIVGEPGAGKTSLAKKLQDPSYELQKQEKSTEGIEVNRWYFTTTDGKRFRVNIWDFGGQEIYHATHQFFLTKRSVYALVADTRKEDTDFYYWLNVVELLSDASPVLIVKNEKQNRQREINERQLRGEFVRLEKPVATNLATNRGLNDVLSDLKYLISRLPHIGTPLPKTWIRVRESLEKDQRDYISINEFLEICGENGFVDLDSKLRLADYLHDLGVCLHFQKDPLLKNTVILKPNWGTDAVYRVLDNKDVTRNLGRFTKADLINIWHEKKYDGMHDQLLQLMINFRLCYRIEGEDTYIAPQLLSENEPVYNWDDSNNLIMRYSYEFMPKGILTRLIVAMHSLISEHTLVWKTGVILEREGTKAEIREHYGRREIVIRVSGGHRKDLLTIIIYELDKIQRTFKRLKYSAFIPCNCTTCKGSKDPGSYSYDTLKDFIDRGQETIQCHKSFSMVGVRGLIDDVIATPKLPDKSGTVFSGPITFKGDVQTVVVGNSLAPSGDPIMPLHSSPANSPKSPWASGSFYIFLFVVVIAGLAILANTVSVYVLPIVLVAGILIVPIIGALQLRQDTRLSEKGFLQLMKLAIQQLPLIRNLSRHEGPRAFDKEPVRKKMKP